MMKKQFVMSLGSSVSSLETTTRGGWFLCFSNTGERGLGPEGFLSSDMRPKVFDEQLSMTLPGAVLWLGRESRRPGSVGPGCFPGECDTQISLRGRVDVSVHHRKETAWGKTEHAAVWGLPGDRSWLCGVQAEIWESRGWVGILRSGRSSPVQPPGGNCEDSSGCWWWKNCTMKEQPLH